MTGHPFPFSARALLRFLLPRFEFDSLIGCYERDYQDILLKQGRRKARQWLRWQIVRAVPAFLKMILTGEMSMFGNYLKTAFRNLMRHKGYSSINIFGLAVGMACCLLIFLWVRHEWSYDRFHQNKDNIHRVVVSWPQGDGTHWTWRTPPPLAGELMADFPEIKQASRFYTVSGILVEQDQVRFKENIGLADPLIFSIFTLPLRSGSPEALLADPQSLVISKTAALKYFGSDDPIGKTMVLNDSLSFQVAAVMEDIPVNSVLHCHILAPFIHLEAFTGYGRMENWGDFGYNTFILLEKNSLPPAVNGKLKDYLDMKWEQPENDTELSLQALTRLHLYELGGGGPIVYIWIFSAIAAFILLIACINFMNLATARSATRAREIGVRKVVGAERHRIILQFISESLLLSLISLLIALVLMAALLKPLASLAGVADSGLLFSPHVIPIFILLTLITGLLAGSYPALFLSSFRPVEVLTGRQRSGSPLFRKSLVVFQFSISVFLLIGLLIVSGQMNYLSRKPLGFDKEQIVYIPVNESFIARYEPFRQEALGNSNVINMALASNYLGRSSKWATSGIRWEGKNPEEDFSLNMIYADYDFADTFDLRLTAGRFFSREYETDPVNFVLNESAIKRMGIDDPIGMKLNVAGQQGRIIGIIQDFHFRSLHSTVEPLVVVMEPRYYRYLAVKISSGDLSGTLDFLQGVYSTFSPKYPFEYKFLDDVLNQVYQAEQRSQMLLRSFAALAGFISCLGLFGLASFMVERRTKEIGVRKVLGASGRGIFLLLSRTFIRWVLIANLIAWPLAYYAMSRWLQNFAFRTPVNVAWFLFAGIVSLGIALLTITGQVVKVARANPSRSLRYE